MTLTCEQAREAIFLGSPDAPVDTHLASCAECAELALAHRAALRLENVMPRPWRVARRRVVKRLALVVGAAGLLVASSPVLRLNQRLPDRPQAEATHLAQENRPQAVVPSSGGDDTAEWLAFASLHRGVELDAHRDPRVHDASYGVFGALPEWVAPTRLGPMRALGPAVSPLVYTQED